METLTKKLANKERRISWKQYFSFLLFTVILSINSFAQDLKNISNTLASIKAEQENIAFHEKMSYVYMAIGLLAVIAVAWFSTALSKKMKDSAAEQKKLNRHYVRHHHDPRRRSKAVRSAM
ncbi:MAG: hypothetical protein NTX97_11000 [Bacteroidetes bacterium]|nr:hypothetical protein [Bacteroidota bacterium]